MSSENTLRTLKDLPVFLFGGEYEGKELIDRKELKQEAIKWIQEDIDEGDKNDIADLIIKWYKRFNLIEDRAFNITDEDLK